jgi:uncharacterized protein YggT (Ycf19 family)
VSSLVLLIQLYLLLVALDVGLGWVQEDPGHMPRRASHLLTEPPQALIRRLVRPEHFGGWDLSPLVVIGALGVLRVWLMRCCL